MLVGCLPGGLVLRNRVDGLAARHPHLDGAKVVEIARHRRLRRNDAFVAQEINQLRLARDRLDTDQSADRLLALDLGRHG